MKIFILFFGLSTAGLLHAEGLKTAYVSVNKAVEQTGEQKRILKALERERNRVQAIVRKRSESLNKSAEKIRRQMALMADDEKVKKYDELQKMQVSMEQFVKTKEMEFQKKEADMRKQFMDQLKTVVAAVAKKEKIEEVRNLDALLWVSSKRDITDKVARAYKKKYKK